MEKQVRSAAADRQHDQRGERPRPSHMQIPSPPCPIQCAQRADQHLRKKAGIHTGNPDQRHQTKRDRKTDHACDHHNLHQRPAFAVRHEVVLCMPPGNRYRVGGKQQEKFQVQCPIGKQITAEPIKERRHDKQHGSADR